MKNLRKLIIPLLPVLLWLTFVAGNSNAALLDVGPQVAEVIPSTPPQHGYPLWYRDQNRLPLEICLSTAESPNAPGSTMCNLLPGATYDPALPMAFPTNFPDETFWWATESTVKNGFVRALLVLAVEGAWNTEEIASGQQIAFARVRIMVDTPMAGTYRIVFPYGERTFVDVPAGTHAIFHTEDIGIQLGNFEGALKGGVGPFLTWDSGIPINVNGELFIGDPNVEHTITGSPLGTNYFRIEGPPGSNLDGLGNDSVQNNLFAVTGKIHQQAIPTPLKVDKAVYARDAAGAQVSVFATTQPVANPTNSLAPFPGNYALLGTPSALQVAGAGIPTVAMATNQPADGKFFSATGLFPDPGTLPATVTVTNSADLPATVKTVPLVDEVVVQTCTYNPATQTLSVQASSLDAVGQPALQLFMPGREAALGTLNAGTLDIVFPFTDNGPPIETFEIPPQGVTVKSNNGGFATAPVSVYLPQYFPVSASAGPNGTISPAGITMVERGTAQSYTITPNTGYQVQALVVDGIALPAATSYTLTNVSAPHYINAYFAPLSFTVTASAGAGGSVTPAGAVTADFGTSPSFTFTPSPGYVGSELVVDGQLLPAASSYTFTSIAADHTISANFVPGSYTITAAAGPNGSITPAGASTVSGTSTQSYTITPAAGYLVAALVVDGQLLPGATSYSFDNVSANHYINAYFEPDGGFTIRAAAAVNGSIAPAGAIVAAAASTQSFTITPDPGYRVAALVVDGQTLPGATSYSFDNVSANHYINAYFEPDGGFTIRAAAGANGSITPAGTSVAAAGSTQSYTITPDPGYAVSALVVDGVTLPAAPGYSFENVSANHYINAYFAPAGPGFTIRAAAGANGSISQPGATFVPSGADQSYTITPNPGYSVAALVVDGATLPGATSYTFPAVAAPHYINAYFAPAGPGFNIRAAAGPNGSITPAGTTYVLAGADQTYSITPSPGYQIAALVVDGAVLPGAASHTFTGVSGEHYINAYFSPAP